jgi:catechol 2,3-dioxygenase-like lactoylglutathione lyase family enzyme
MCGRTGASVVVSLLASGLLASAFEPYVRPQEQLVTEVHVSDLDRSIAFYEALGFELVRRENTFAELEWESVLFFLDSAQKPPSVETPAANIRIMVPNVDDFWDKARRLDATVFKSIEDRYYGLRDFTILDPDGFGIRFATRLEDLPRRRW